MVFEWEGLISTTFLVPARTNIPKGWRVRGQVTGLISMCTAESAAGRVRDGDVFWVN